MAEIKELVKELKSMSEKDKKHPSPMQRALIADVLLGLCDALITDDSETDAKSKTTGKKASK